MHAHPAYRFDRAAALSFASARGFGTIVAYDGKWPVASPLPFQLAYRVDGTPTVCFHVARNNPLAALSGQGGNWLIAVSGADAYVSPDWYVSPQQVPTWLYEAVHLSGPVQPVSGTRRLDHLDRLTEQFERPADSTPAWTSARLAVPRREAMLDAITVIEMEIENVEGVAKLNQTKSDADFRAVMAHLGAQDNEMARQISDRMVALRPNLAYEKTEEGMLLMADRKKIAVLGASGYTGSETVRLLLNYPGVTIAALTADRRAGHEMREVFPQFFPYDLPKLVPIEELDFTREKFDLAFCALPHATTQKVVKALLAAAPETKVVDLSADFRLQPAPYAKWYGHDHLAPELQSEAVYGLTEVYRDRVQKARLVANPGCYTTCAQLPLIPLLKANAIDPDEIVVDAKSGMTGAGRSAKEAMLFSEVSEGFNAYGVGHHRHMAELDQEFTIAAGREVIVSFTPHLVPMNRGILSTIYVRSRAQSPEQLHAILLKSYAKEPFVHVLPFGELPQTRHVRGSNMTFIGVAKDRIPGRTIIVSALDNLVKGAAGQAVQNMNLMLGFPETTGLTQVALFP